MDGMVTLGGVRAAFQQGTIAEIWKNDIEAEKWFDPDFQGFIDREIMSSAGKK
jgi:hypothetical protein